MSDLTFSQFIDYVGKVTVITVLSGVIIALYKGWLVPGWVVKERDERIKGLEAQIEKWHELLTRVVEPILPPRRK